MTGADIRARLVPRALVGVTFEAVAGAPVVDMSLDEAVEAKRAIDAGLEETGNADGHRMWFLHAFDGSSLYFLVATFHVTCEDGPGCLEYRAETIVRVARTDEALAALGAGETVALYEVGVRGVRGGMSEDEVVGVLGKPGAVVPLQPPGSFRYVYPDLTVTFHGFEVISVHEDADPG
jgi:hypothetical protein